MKFKDVVKLFVGTIIILGILMIILGFNGQDIDKASNWLIPIGLSFLSSAYIGDWIEGRSGGFFKKIYLSFPIPMKNRKFRVNIPISIILFFLIKIIIFK